MATEKASPEYSESFRRALRRLITKQVTNGRVNLKSGAAEDLFARGTPQDVLTALLETIAVLATDDLAQSDPIDRIDYAVGRLGRNKRKAKP